MTSLFCSPLCSALTSVTFLSPLSSPVFTFRSCCHLILLHLCTCVQIIRFALTIFLHPCGLICPTLTFAWTLTLPSISHIYRFLTNIAFQHQFIHHWDSICIHLTCLTKKRYTKVDLTFFLMFSCCKRIYHINIHASCNTSLKLHYVSAEWSFQSQHANIHNFINFKLYMSWSLFYTWFNLVFDILRQITHNSICACLLWLHFFLKETRNVATVNIC